MPPQSPPMTDPDVYTSGTFDRLTAERNHAKPNSTMSMPVRLSGRLRQAYRPVPTNAHPTAGPKIAQTTCGSWWSLVSASAPTPTPQTRAASTTRRMRLGVIVRSSRRALRHATQARHDLGMTSS